LTIRKAENNDLQQLIKLLYEFYKESIHKYKIKISAETAVKTAKNFIKNYVVLVLEDGEKIVGVMAGIVSPSIFDETQLFAQEAIWYINKQHRKGSGAFKLLKKFESVCKDLGADIIIMGGMGNLNLEVLNRFYLKNNYILMETHYIKEF